MGIKRRKREAIQARNDEKARFYGFMDSVRTNPLNAAKMLAEDPTLLDARSGLGETALHYLAVENELDAIRWLHAHGAELNVRNDFGATPLREAAQLGYYDLCAFLLEHGADQSLRDNTDETALSSAATASGASQKAVANKLALVDLLLSYLPPQDDINVYFSALSVADALNAGGPITNLLAQRGLRLPAG